MRSSGSRMAVESTSLPASSCGHSRTGLFVVIRIDPPAVALGHQVEARAGLLSIHRLKAEFVADEQARRQILAASQPVLRQSGIAFQMNQLLVEPHTRGPWISSVSALPSRLTRRSSAGTIAASPPTSATGRAASLPVRSK
jgi:hypothetical protein